MTAPILETKQPAAPTMAGAGFLITVTDEGRVVVAADDGQKESPRWKRRASISDFDRL